MAVYGSRVTGNRTKPGGDLGTKQYFYTTDKNLVISNLCLL